MKKTLLALTLVPALLGAPQVWADPYTPFFAGDGYAAFSNGIPTPNSATDGPHIFQAFNALTGSSFTNNSDVDSFQYLGQDSIWKTKGNDSVSLIGLSAGNSNTLFAYTTNPAGSTSNVFHQSFTGEGLLDPAPTGSTGFAVGTEFGWTLQSIAPDGGTAYWDSDPNKNSSLLDHMLTYRLTDLIGKSYELKDKDGNITTRTFIDPYLLAWEDLPLSAANKLGDEDYNDLLYVVDNVAPVGAPVVATPEPVSMILFMLGGGILLMSFWRRKYALARIR